MNNIIDDNYYDNYDGRLVLMVLDSWLMMTFAADEYEKGYYGRTEYYKKQFFRKMKKKIAIERKVQASS